MVSAGCEGEASRAIGAETWYADHAPGREPVARITNAVALMALVNAGVGGALLPVPLARQTELVQLAGPVDGFDTDLWCLCHNDLRHSERVRRFMDAVVDYGLELE